jgi:coatomer subunit beta'
LALQLTSDLDHKFDLAISIDDLEIALEIARVTPSPESDARWKAVGDRALAVWKFDQAKECYEKARDSSSLLLLYLATGDREGLSKLAALSGM